MSREDTITQNRWGSKTWFIFGEDTLEFSLRDYSGEATSTLPYNNINLENKSTIKVNVARRYYIVIVVGGLLVALIMRIGVPDLRPFSFLPFVLAILTYFVLRLFNLMTVTFTVLRPASGAGTPIRIIHDRKHDEVLRRIKSGWIARLRKLHLAVNPANDPRLETQKFKWLLDHGVILEAEYQGAIAQLRPPTASTLADSGQVVH